MLCYHTLQLHCIHLHLYACLLNNGITFFLQWALHSMEWDVYQKHQISLYHSWENSPVPFPHTHACYEFPSGFREKQPRILTKKKRFVTDSHDRERYTVEKTTSIASYKVSLAQLLNFHYSQKSDLSIQQLKLHVVLLDGANFRKLIHLLHKQLNKRSPCYTLFFSSKFTAE